MKEGDVRLLVLAVCEAGIDQPSALGLGFTSLPLSATTPHSELPPLRIPLFGFSGEP